MITLLPLVIMLYIYIYIYMKNLNNFIIKCKINYVWYYSAFTILKMLRLSLTLFEIHLPYMPYAISW